MADEMRTLREVNPVPATEVAGWVDTDAAKGVLAQVLDRVRGDVEELEPGRRPVARNWVFAVGAFALVLLIGVPALLIDSGADQSPVAGSVSLGVDHVWPEDGHEGDPVAVAAAFAADVLGWDDVSTTVEPGSAARGPAWVDIHREDREVLAVLTVPIGQGRRVISQVRSSSDLAVAVDDADAEAGQSVTFSPVQGAVVARLHVRLVDGSQLRIEVDRNQLDEGRVAIGDGARVVSALIVYQDGAGEAIGATGGHFAVSAEADVMTPREILVDGVITGSEYYNAATAVLACLETADVDASMEIDSRGASFTTRGTTEEIFEQCHGRHMGAVATAWADQNATSPEREVAFYNEVVDCVEAETGAEYGEVEGRGDTRATDAAIADAPVRYDACLDRVLETFPGFGFGS